MATTNNVTVSFDQHSIRKIDKLTKAVERLADLREREIRLEAAKTSDEAHLYSKADNESVLTDTCPDSSGRV